MLKRIKLKDQNISRAIVCICLVCISIGVGVWLGLQKDLFYCDEAWTYESANSTWKEHVFSKTCQWISGKDISDFLAATDKSFRFGEILDNLWTDHVPLYFWLFRLVSVLFFTGSSTVWVGLTLNLLFYTILTVWLYCAIDDFLKQNAISATLTGVFLWTVPMMLEHVTLIRMYLLLFTECVVTMWLFLRFMTANEPALDSEKYNKSRRQKFRLYIALFIVVTLGLLTHYYYWPFVLIAGVYAAVILLVKHNFKSVFGIVSVGALSAVCATIIDKAKWAKNLFRDNGQLAVNQLRSTTKTFQFDLAGVFEKIGDSVCLFGLDWKIKLVLVSAVIIAAIIIRKQRQNKNYYYAVIFTVLTIFSCSVVISAANIKDFVRYYWPLLMLWNLLFYISIGVILKELMEASRDSQCQNRYYNKIFLGIAFIFLAAIALYNIKTIDSGNGLYYLGKAESDDDFLRDNTDIPWIVYSDTFDYDEESLLFDLKLADKLCLIRTSDFPANDGFTLPDEDTFLLFCRSEAIEEAMKFLETAGERQLSCDKIEGYHNTVFSFYRVESLPKEITQKER